MLSFPKGTHSTVFQRLKKTSIMLVVFFAMFSVLDSLTPDNRLTHNPCQSIKQVPCTNDSGLTNYDLEIDGHNVALVSNGTLSNHWEIDGSIYRNEITETSEYWALLVIMGVALLIGLAIFEEELEFIRNFDDKPKWIPKKISGRYFFYLSFIGLLPYAATLSFISKNQSDYEELIGATSWANFFMLISPIILILFLCYIYCLYKAELTKHLPSEDEGDTKEDCCEKLEGASDNDDLANFEEDEEKRHWE